jgi:hypothetical protein
MFRQALPERSFALGETMFEIGKTALLVCGEFTHADYPVGVTPMPRCEHCDGHVSENFVRVFADEDGQVRACPNCSANAGIAEVSRERGRKA